MWVSVRAMVVHRRRSSGKDLDLWAKYTGHNIDDAEGLAEAICLLELIRSCGLAC